MISPVYNKTVVSDFRADKTDWIGPTTRIRFE